MGQLHTLTVIGKGFYNMAAYPGFFASVTFGADVLTTPNGTYNVTGLTYAMVLHEEALEWNDRWTTWTLDADSMYLYQPNNGPNRILVGNNGHIYQLEDETTTDEDAAIPIELVSGPLPIVSQTVTASSFKRITEVWWDLVDVPPSTGYSVTVTLTDINDATNVNSVVVTQLKTRMYVKLTLRCQQAYLSLKTSVGKDFNVSRYGMKFQQESSRKLVSIQ